MAKLTRVTGKVFAGSAQAEIGGIGQFGSALAGTPNPTTDVATIQALPAYSNGWGSAVISSRNFPPIEEVNGALKTISYQGCYLLQEGIPEYDINTEYSNTSVTKSISENNLNFYLSLQPENIGNSLTNTNYWKKILSGQDVLNVLDPDFILLPSSGTINLTTNSVNYINPAGAVTFVLPSVSADTKLNQILIQVNLTDVYSINVGTEHYFNGKTPNMSTTGMYDLIFEYDESQNIWVCGWMRKS